MQNSGGGRGATAASLEVLQWLLRTVKRTNCGTEAAGRLPGAEVEGQTQGVPLGVEEQVHWYQPGREPAPERKEGADKLLQPRKAKQCPAT